MHFFIEIGTYLNLMYVIVTIIYSAIMIMFFFYFSIKSVVFGQPNIENL